jgi:hypothetical protein
MGTPIAAPAAMNQSREGVQLLERMDLGLLMAALALLLIVIARSASRSNLPAPDGDGLGVRELVSQLRAELVTLNAEATTRARKDGTPPLLVFGSADIDVSFVVKQDGKGSLKIVTVEAGATYSTEQVQRVLVKLLPAETSTSGSSPPEGQPVQKLSR